MSPKISELIQIPSPFVTSSGTHLLPDGVIIF